MRADPADARSAAAADRGHGRRRPVPHPLAERSRSLIRDLRHQLQRLDAIRADSKRVAGKWERSLTYAGFPGSGAARDRAEQQPRDAEIAHLEENVIPRLVIDLRCAVGWWGAHRLRQLMEEWMCWCKAWPSMANEAMSLVVVSIEEGQKDAKAAAAWKKEIEAEQKRFDALKAEAAAAPGSSWGVRFLSMFSMSEDSWRFETADSLREAGFEQDGNVFRAPDDPQAGERLRQRQEARRLVMRKSRKQQIATAEELKAAGYDVRPPMKPPPKKKPPPGGSV